jgi:phosphatidylglycerol:prolipoprotein diacylglycerol transferase
MYPVITKIGPFTLHTFGVMLALAILVGSAILTRETRRLGDPAITEERLQKLIWYVVIAVVAGGRLMYVITEWSHFAKNPLKILAIWEGGLVMYGGLIATFFTVVGFARKHKINVLRLCDLVAPSAFLGDAIGRWGCFFAGDDYGRPTDSWVGVRFTDPECLVPVHLRGVPLHPTQIYMSMKALAIAGILFWLTRRKKFDGQVVGWSFILYAVFRSFIEFFRGDEDRGAVFHFDFELFGVPLSWGSTAQFTSIFGFALGLLLLMLAPKKTLADDLAAADAGQAIDEPRSKRKKKRSAG